MKNSMRLLASVLLSISILGGFACSTKAATPPVRVGKALLDTRNQNQPDLPDDFAPRQGAVAPTEEITIEFEEVEYVKDEAVPVEPVEIEDPGVKAEWKEVVVAAAVAEPVAKVPYVVIHTDTRRCPPCQKMKQGFAQYGEPKFLFETKDYEDGTPWPFSLPRTIITMPDGRTFTYEGSVRGSTLDNWYKAKTGLEPSYRPPVAVLADPTPSGVQVTLSDVPDAQRASAATQAFLEHLRRSESDIHVSGSFLPTIPVDVPDFLLAIMAAVDSPQGYTIGPVRASWPGGKITMDPPFKLKITKWITFSATLTSISIDGTTLHFALEGIPDLTVRFK